MTGIITLMINSFLEQGPSAGTIGNVAYVGNHEYHYKPCDNVKDACYTQGKLYGIAITFIVFVVISVPIMLCAIPCYFRQKGVKIDEALVEMIEGKEDPKASGYNYAV
tara:strand:- start:31 stop:354 length:324 start_codon:yes stop_codon:yes gene_type:complete